jgi:type I restriction-modification system DNA methylase subunit
LSRIKKERKPSDEVNYTLYKQKLKFDFLKGHLWKATDILSSLAPSEYRQPVMTVLPLKKLNDSFEEKAEKLISEDKSQKETYENKNRLEEYLL